MMRHLFSSVLAGVLCQSVSAQTSDSVVTPDSITKTLTVAGSDAAMSTNSYRGPKTTTVKIAVKDTSEWFFAPAAAEDTAIHFSTPAATYSFEMYGSLTPEAYRSLHSSSLTVISCTQEIPTCSCLHKKDSLFYANQDSIPYSGTCVVLYLNNSPGTTLCRYTQYAQAPSVLTAAGEKVKIVSHYDQGKRDGSREYYDENGKLIKTEIYDHGILRETIYPSISKQQ